MRLGGVYVLLVLGMAIDVRPDERAIKGDSQPARDCIIQHGTGESRANSLAFEVLVNLGVDERHPVRSALVLGESDHPVVELYLPPAFGLVVLDFHWPKRILSRDVASRSALAQEHG